MHNYTEHCYLAIFHAYWSVCKCLALMISNTVYYHTQSALTRIILLCSGSVLHTMYLNMELLITQYKVLRLKALSRSLK